MKHQVTQIAVVLAIGIICGVGVPIIINGGFGQTVPVDGGLRSTERLDVATPNLTPAGPSPRDRPSSATSDPSPVVQRTESPSFPAATSDRVALQVDTPVARTWRDSAGTARVHVVVSVTNDTSDVRSVAATERTFRLISAAGRTVHTGRFPYAFPSVVPPGGTSYLITTVVLPVGMDATDFRVETEILSDITTAVQPMLAVSDLRLVSSAGRPGVRGIVRNTGVEDVNSGVIAVIGRDASGRVIGGFYDNVNVASIAAGGEATFQTEYPGLPPAAAGRIVDLGAVAFDVGYQP